MALCDGSYLRVSGGARGGTNDFNVGVSDVWGGNWAVVGVEGTRGGSEVIFWARVEPGEGPVPTFTLTVFCAKLRPLSVEALVTMDALCAY